MSSQTLEKALQTGATHLDGLLRQYYDHITSELGFRTESPIEEAFLAGLVFYHFITPAVCFEGGGITGGYHGTFVIFTVKSQVQVGPYRVDFAIDVRDGGDVLGTVLIECDGHNFHERTKEQAARDRARDRDLTMQGFQVLRFTGSEIYEDATKCAGQAVRAAVGIFEKWDESRG